MDCFRRCNAYQGGVRGGEGGNDGRCQGDRYFDKKSKNMHLEHAAKKNAKLAAPFFQSNESPVAKKVKDAPAGTAMEGYESGLFREEGLPPRPCQVLLDNSLIESSCIGHNGNMQEIIVEPVEENGKDLPSGKKLGDYMNEKGRMDVLKFF